MRALDPVDAGSLTYYVERGALLGWTRTPDGDVAVDLPDGARRYFPASALLAFCHGVDAGLLANTQARETSNDG